MTRSPLRKLEPEAETQSEYLLGLSRRWADLSQRYAANYHNGSGPPNSIRVVGSQDQGWVFTAPHSIDHVRAGRTKVAELFTGGLAELLAERCGGIAIAPDGPQTGD